MKKSVNTQYGALWAAKINPLTISQPCNWTFHMCNVQEIAGKFGTRIWK